ncbi:hypothetical protein BGZ99_002972 [Dissophora globulifera]|uniref:F-box domain-containing protein n=1 Tax=Dissophora globulifera TaxID=979702 RepID=A0A9P6RMF2_9FUNG|nr:hypothetical protein BGZ99_002972 [Dissophora globulifera]
MDIISRVPVEIAYQILSRLDIQDLAACQSVSRQWYWITVEQSIWKDIFLENERPFAIPELPSSIACSSVLPTVADAQALAGPASRSTSTSSLSQPCSSLSASTSASTLLSARAVQERDWKQECRTRIISDRNWSKGHIQSLSALRVHRGGIVRLRIKSGKLLSGDMFGQIAVWDTVTYNCEDLIDAAVGPIQLLDFSAAAMIMTVISKSGVCRIWDLKTKRLIHSRSAIDVTCMTMNDEYLVLGQRDCKIDIMDFTTGQKIKSSKPLPGEVLQDIYIQNGTLIVATAHFIRILSIDTLEVLLSSPLPISDSVRTFCSVFHIRSLILLTDKHLLHVEWEPLYKSPNKQFLIDTRYELPPNLCKAPYIHKTIVPPISTITSIAIGGSHPHVLTTNADRPSLNDAIRVCPTAPRHSAVRSHDDRWQREQKRQDQQQQEGPIRNDIHMYVNSTEEPEIIGEGTQVMTTEDSGIVLTSQVDEITHYLETCGLKPSFMDVDGDVIVIGTSKGDIVVLNMMA